MKAVLKVWVERTATGRWDTDRIISNHLGPIVRRQVHWKRQHCWETRKQQETRKTRYEMDSLYERSQRHASTGEEQGCWGQDMWTSLIHRVARSQSQCKASNRCWVNEINQSLMLLSGSAGIYTGWSDSQAQETSITSSLHWLDFSRLSNARSKCWKHLRDYVFG